MNEELNYILLNNKNIGISKIELNKDELLVIDKSSKYTFHITLAYDWRKINKVEIGTKEDIMFNEYYLIENNESVLIWPCISQVHKISKDYISFYLKFLNIDNAKDTCYMNKKGHFDIPLNSLQVKVYINYKDAKEGKIIYEGEIG